MSEKSKFTADCPDPKDRVSMAQDWSCDEFKSFRNLQLVSDIDILVFKIFQVLMFGSLAVIISRQRCKGETMMGRTPVLISILMILNAVAEILCAWSLEYFFFFPNQQQYDAFVVSFIVE